MTSRARRRLALRAAAPAVLAAVLAASPALAGQAPTSSTAGLPLTMEQAVAMALEANLGLKGERLNVEAADLGIVSARSAFLPQLTSSFSRRTARSVPSDFTQGQSVFSSAGASVGTTMNQVLPWYGSSYAVSWSASRSTANGGINTFNPRLGASLALSFSQPLLRDFAVDGSRVGLETSQRQRVITDLQVNARVIALEVSVRFAYLNLVAAMERLKVAQQNLDIRERSLAQALSRVRVGTSAQIDVIQAEADVASNREQVILAQAAIAASEDGLRTLILDPSRADYWTLALTPTDTITLTPRRVELDAAIQNALANRLDLAVQRRSMEITDLTRRLRENDIKPQVDFTLQYLAQGTGGTQFEFGAGFPPPVVNRIDRGFGSVLGDTFAGTYPTWTVGVNVAYPIGRTAAEAALAQTLVTRRQQELQLRQTELQIVQEVRDAARQVQNSYERVQATRAALAASERQLEAEERKFEVGLSTTLDLQIRQGQLSTARVAELNARIDYNRALINFDRVQKTQ
jgi:outer membrane protein TolC